MNGHDGNVHLAPQLLAAIVDRSESVRLETVLRERNARFQYMFHAKGTASSEILKAFGLSGTEKIVCICVEPAYRARPLMMAVAERMELTHPGNGIVFMIPISGISATISHTFEKDFETQREGWGERMEQETEKLGQEAHFELVVALVNQGFNEDVMDVARAFGARGGTIINARRTGVEDASKFFGISLQAEKEVVAIVVHKSQKKELMQAISSACGMKTDARGIVISLPVESCAGISLEEEKEGPGK